MPAVFDDLIPPPVATATAGAFDDLIPRPPAATPARGAFDDLIPEDAPETLLARVLREMPSLTLDQARRVALGRVRSAVETSADLTPGQAFWDELGERANMFSSRFLQVVPDTLKTAGTLGTRLSRAAGAPEAETLPEADPLFRAGRVVEGAIADAFPTAAEPDIAANVVGGAGQIAQAIVPARALGLGAKGAQAFALGSMGVQEFQDAFGRARARGDDPDTAFAKALGYATVASLIENKLGVGRLLRTYLPDPATAVKTLTALGISRALIGNFIAGGLEEGSQRWAQNLIVEGRPSLEGVVEEAIPGAIVQGLAGAPGTVAHAGQQRAARGAFDDLLPKRPSSAPLPPATSEHPTGFGSSNIPRAPATAAPAGAQPADAGSPIAELKSQMAAPIADLAQAARELTAALQKNQIVKPAATPDLSAALTAAAEGETKKPGAAAETLITGQNERTGSEARAATTLATQPMPAEVQPAAPVTESTAATPSPRPTSPTRKRYRKTSPITEADGLLLDIVGDYGQVPIFTPPGIEVAQLRRLAAKGWETMTSNERELWKRLRAKLPANYEDNFGVNGEQAAAAYAAAKRAGFAGELFVRVKDARGGTMATDKLLDFLRARKGPDYTLQDLWSDIERVANEHAARETEGRQAAAFEQRVLRGERPARESGRVEIYDAQTLRPGDQFAVQGQTFEVRDQHADPRTGTPVLQVRDGPKFGEQTVYGREPLHVDAGSFQPGPEHGGAPPQSTSRSAFLEAPPPARPTSAAQSEEVRSDTSGPTRREEPEGGVRYSLAEAERAQAVKLVRQIVREELGPEHNFTVSNAEPPRPAPGKVAQAEVSPDGRRVTIYARAPGMDDPATVRRVVREERAHQMLSSAVGRRAVRRFALESLTEAAERELRAQGYTGTRAQLADEFIAKQAREQTAWWQKLVDRVRAWLADHGLARLSPEETARAILRSLEQGAEGQRGKGAEGQGQLRAGNATVDTRPGLVAIGGRPAMALTAHHGTPHEFERFTTEKIGTGEGAHVYGWGLYFAENPEVSRAYARTLAADRHGKRSLYDGKPFDRLDPRHWAAEALEIWRPSQASQGLERLKESIAAQGVPPEVFQRARRSLESGDVAKTSQLGANVYTVTLDVEPEQLLDWDKPLSEQSEKVKAGVADLARRVQFFRQIGLEDTGQSIYSSVRGYFAGHGASDQLASAELSRLGIKGIRYLDQFSRVQLPGNRAEYQQKLSHAEAMLKAWKSQPVPEDLTQRSIRDSQIENWQKDINHYTQLLRAGESNTYNYVIFDESVIKITHRNGQPVKLSEIAEESPRYSLADEYLGTPEEQGAEEQRGKGAEEQGTQPEPARPHEPTQETKHWHKLRDRWFAAADNLTRLERRAEELRRTASVPPELRQELTFARKQYRELRKALNRSEEYVADTLIELHAIQRQIANARAAGIPERARELQFLLDGEIGRLDAIPPTILQRVWDRLVAEGRLPRPTSLSDSLSAAGLEREAQAERRRATQQAQPTPVTREEAAAGGAPPAGVAPPVAAAAQRRADAAVTAATSSSFDPKADLPTLWERFRAGLRKFASTVPEVPLFGEGSQYYMPMREFAQRVRRAVSVAARQAQEDVGQVLESLLALPKDVIQANALNRFQAAGRKARTIRKAYEDQLDALVRRLNQMAESPGAVPTARFQATQAELRRLQDNPPPALAQAERELAEAQDAIQDNPVHLFRQAVILRDLDWRARQLAQDEEHPFRLPNGVAHEDVLTELERIEEAIAASPHRAAIEAALDKHGALVANIRRELEARGEIIPAQFDNPFYFPHHILDFHTGRLAGAQPTTESPFRPYLITPVGSERAIESDYVLALYKHAADVRMHNAQVDAVQEVLKPLDISQQIKDKVAARAEAQGRTAYPNEWRSEKNLPPGYVFYDAAKKLTLRADEIIDRETLAKALGVQLAGNTPLREMLTRLGVDVKITPEMLRDALVAGEKQPWVIPAEMADALNGLERRFKARQFGESGAFGKVARTFTRLWKLNTLYNPKNWLRYEFGNTLTDVMDKLVGADPGMRRYLPRAWNEVRDFLRGGEGTPEIRRAFELGVLDTVTFNEVAKVKDSAQFNALMSDNQLRWATAKGLASFGLRGSNFRESLFRYAKFLADLERMRRGERPYYAGAYWRDAEWFETNEEKAAYISRRTFGDYQDVSVNGEYLRAKLIPFWSWTETNFRYHANALRNLADMVRLGEREAATAAGRAIAGRAAGTTAQAAGWALRLALPWIAVQTWNALSGLEDDLSEEDRRRFHIILGRDKEGRILVTYLNTAWGDVVAWFGGQRFAQLALDALHGRVSPGQAAVDWAKSAPQDFVNRAVQSTGPLVKTAYEAAARKRVFPDVFDQRGIAPHDQVWNIVENLTDRDAVSFLRRIADRDYYGRDVSDWLQQMVLQIRRRDPEQWAYYEAREAASDWKFARTGKRYEAGEYTSRDAEAVRNFKRALYRGDVAAANRFYGRLREYGYTEERLKATMRAQDPLADLTADERRVYEAGLDAKARRELALARTYYARLTGAKDTYRFPTRAQVEAQRARP